MKKLFLALLLSAAALQAQREGMWQGFDGEWRHVSRQIVALAEATPPQQFAWRPAPGVRSFSEVCMHIALTNYELLQATGQPPKVMPAVDMEKAVTSKAAVIDWLQRSLDAVAAAHAALPPGALQRKVRIDHQNTAVDAVYLRLLVHANEHMGQLIAYARMNGIVPPWSKPGA